MAGDHAASAGGIPKRTNCHERGSGRGSSLSLPEKLLANRHGPTQVTDTHEGTLRPEGLESTNKILLAILESGAVANQRSPNGTNSHVQGEQGHYPAAYLGIANALAVIATFAGAFTYGNVITLRTISSTCQPEFHTLSILLSVAFILFTTSLFVTIAIPVILRRRDPNEIMTADNNNARINIHCWVQILFAASAIFLGAGFVLLNVGLILLHVGSIDRGLAAVGGTGIGLVVIVGIVTWVLGCRTSKEVNNEDVKD